MTSLERGATFVDWGARQTVVVVVVVEFAQEVYLTTSR
jgi:hypothetical protein